MTDKNIAKVLLASVTRCFEADEELLRIATLLFNGEIPVQDVRFSTEAVREDTKYAPCSVVADAGNSYTAADGSVIQRYVCYIANTLLSMMLVKGFRFTPDRVLATLKGTIITATLRENSEIAGDRLRHGVLRNPSKGEKEAFARAGVAPNYVGTGDQRRAFGFCPVDGIETTDDWVESRERLMSLTSQFSGILPLDEDGNQHTPQAVVAAIKTANNRTKQARKRQSEARKVKRNAVGGKPRGFTLTGTEKEVEELHTLLGSLDAKYDPKSKTKDVTAMRMILVLARAAVKATTVTTKAAKAPASAAKATKVA